MQRVGGVSQLLANRTVIFTPDGSIYFRCLHSV